MESAFFWRLNWLYLWLLWFRGVLVGGIPVIWCLVVFVVTLTVDCDFLGACELFSNGVYVEVF